MIYKNSQKNLKPESKVEIPSEIEKTSIVYLPERKTSIYLAVCATVVLVLLFFAVTDLLSYRPDVTAPAPTAQTSSIAMDTTMSTSPTPGNLSAKNSLIISLPQALVEETGNKANRQP